MSIKDNRGWNIYRRRDGSLVLQFRDGPRGAPWKEHRIPAEFRTERAAERYGIAWLDEYRAKLGVRPDAPVEPPPDKGPTIRDLHDKWNGLRQRDPKLSRATRVQNSSNMARHVLPYAEISDAPISELGSGALRTWLRKVRDGGRLKKVTNAKDEKSGRGGKWVRTGKPLAPFTTRNIVNTLTAFFDDAMAEEWIDIPANPMRHPGVRKEIPDGVTRAGRRTIVHFTKPAVEALLVGEKIPEHRRARYSLAVVSGMRDGEIAALRWDDLDLDAATLSITKGTTTKGGPVKLTDTKTDASARIIPMHPVAAKALKAWKASGWARWAGRHPRPVDHVFPNPERKLWRPPSAKLLRADLAALDPPTLYQGKHRFDFHAFRRTFYTWLRNATVERETAEMIMGHAGSSVGAPHYDARDMDRMRTAVSTITLDLRTGEVVAMPLRKASGADTRPTDTAELTAPRGKRAVSNRGFPSPSQYARSDSNGRHSASKADALSS